MAQPVPKAVRFASGPPSAREGFAKHMFQEDLYSGIAPYSLRRGNNECISVTGDEPDRERVSILCASLGRGHSFSVERSVADAIETIGVQLAHYGTALFEKLGGSKDVPLTLSSFSPEHVWSLPGFFLQIVPRQSWSYTKRKYAFIRSKDVWRLRLPRQFGSIRKYRAMLAQLSAWPTLGPDFVHSELEKRRFPQDFSVSDYSRLLRVHQYRVTRDWGWTTRDWSLDYVTEFYQFHRLATFKWAQAILREHIVSELNTFLLRQGIGARVALQNVPLASTILHAREQLKNGAIDFAGLNKALETKVE
jgi:hypothetical protein